MGWVSPSSHSDASDKWTNETKAYDGDLGTYASGQFGATANLVLSLADYVTSYKVRIYCSDATGGDLDEIKVHSKVDGTTTWTHYEGPVPALTWFEISFNSLISVKHIYFRKDTPGNWRIYEVEFWSGADGYEAPAAEDRIIANANVTQDSLSTPMQRKIVVGLNSRIHCTFRKCLYGGKLNHVYYAYSDDYGSTWTIEDPTPAMHTYAQHTPSIAVDSSGNPHIIFRDFPDTNGLVNVGRYVKRSTGGSWSLSNFYVCSTLERWGGATPEPFEFAVGDEVKGATSEVTSEVTFSQVAVGITKRIGFVGGGSGFIVDEVIDNVTNPPNRGTYLGEVGPDTGTALAIMSSNRLVMVAEVASWTWRWVQESLGAPFRHALPLRTGSQVVLDVNPSNASPVVSKDGQSYYDSAGDTLICTGTSAAPTYFSVASDADGNVHFALAQTGLGGDFSGVLNIKYYKRIDLVWSGPIHITDVDYEQRFSSISIDTQGRIHIMWQGKGWGTYPDKFSVLLRTYESGAWGAVQVMHNSIKDQGEYGPGLLHAWHPASNRLKTPLFMFNRQDTWKIQFGGTLPAAIPPDNLLCEQTKNPTNVSDPQPEFSAIYW